jgi:hypothetical protein
MLVDHSYTIQRPVPLADIPPRHVVLDLERVTGCSTRFFV